MKATAELQVIPLGDSVSVRAQISRIVEMIASLDLNFKTHASGTNIEGDFDDILQAVKSAHELLHEDGSVRVLSYLKLETRTDKTPTLAGKRL
ncbi:MAG: MTH1187 family thiamine-binding protein [bacterium]